MPSHYGFRPQSSRSFSSRGGSRGSYGRSRYQMPAHLPHSQYVQAAQAPEAEMAYEAQHAFADFGLEAALLANVLAHGYTTPTPIQDQAMPHLLAGKDVIGIANTGTGKTAAFLLPLLNKILLDPKQGVLILAPTRELAQQIAEEFRIFAKGLPISHCVCIGGQRMSTQIERLRRSPHFVIGTPGRIKDLLRQRAFDTTQFTNVVLDEVDRMLDIGFRQDIQFLIKQLPKQKHAAFFSATMNSEATSIANSFLQNPVTVQVKQKVTSQHIEQNIVKIPEGQKKIEVLHELLIQAEFTKVLVFGRTKHGINKLEELLSERGLRVSSIHGNKSQNARQRSLQEFKTGRVQVLLATDVAARGIDIEAVSHVINYDEPQSYADYIHRIGRTGRAGKMGKALTFVG